MVPAKDTLNKLSMMSLLLITVLNFGSFLSYEMCSFYLVKRFDVYMKARQLSEIARQERTAIM